MYQLMSIAAEPDPLLGGFIIVLSLFKLACGLSFCSSKVVTDFVRFAGSYVKFNCI